jgi:hypothetical protein
VHEPPADLSAEDLASVASQLDHSFRTAIFTRGGLQFPWNQHVVPRKCVLRTRLHFRAVIGGELPGEEYIALALACGIIERFVFRSVEASEASRPGY